MPGILFIFTTAIISLSHALSRANKIFTGSKTCEHWTISLTGLVNSALTLLTDSLLCTGKVMLGAFTYWQGVFARVFTQF